MGGMGVPALDWTFRRRIAVDLFLRVYFSTRNFWQAQGYRHMGVVSLSINCRQRRRGESCEIYCDARSPKLARRDSRRRKFFISIGPRGNDRRGGCCVHIALAKNVAHGFGFGGACGPQSSDVAKPPHHGCDCWRYFWNDQRARGPVVLVEISSWHIRGHGIIFRLRDGIIRTSNDSDQFKLGRGRTNLQFIQHAVDQAVLQHFW